MLLGILSVLFLLRFIWTFNKFDDIFLLTGGNAGTRTLTVNVYEQAFAVSNIGAGAAVAVVILLCLLVFSWFFFRFIAHPPRMGGGGDPVPHRLRLCLLHRHRRHPVLRDGDDEPEEPGELMQNPLDFSIDLSQGWALFRSYEELFRDFNFGQYLWTSFYVSVLTVLITLLFSIPGAYAVARLRFRGQGADSPLDPADLHGADDRAGAADLHRLLDDRAAEHDPRASC
jgi:ABC-type sugar transport system permease subunit